MPAAAAGARKADPVKTTINRALARGAIDAEQRGDYLRSYSRARRTLRALSGQRRAELDYVLDTLRSLARQRRLTARLRPMFLILDRNREWWAKAGPPGSGARLTFGGSRVIFQYFPGEGLQLHPLANFGKLNGYFLGRRNSDLRSLAADLVALGVKRNGYLAWEYYFEFGGGRPPWVSGMAQGTAMQALARAGDRLADPTLTQVARRGLGAFARRTPRGVRVPQRTGDWYALYSFAPRLYVLNGHLQAVNGLRTHAELSGDAAVLERFKAGDAAARQRIASFDTGAWSLYSRPSWVRGPEASLNYHTLNRDFARNLCRGTSERAYCDAADAFTRYLTEDPTLEPQRAVPSPAVAGRGVRFRFRVSKIGRVGVVVRAGGRTYLSTSASFSRGNRYIRWVPPRLRRERTYEYTLYARDLAGNSSSATGEVRVKGAPRR
ncbi:MAG: D-glucuronyl C5-epimerase family protein [Solirubrobacterales bacterium]